MVTRLLLTFHPTVYFFGRDYCMALELIFLGGPVGSGGSGVKVDLNCRLLADESCGLRPSAEKDTSLSQVFKHPMDRSRLVNLATATVAPHLQPEPTRPPKTSSLTVECMITMQRDLSSAVTGADVRFTVSGQCFPAHKNILAARSPVFMAQFFGAMEERSARSVEISDMEPAMFKAMLEYMYTDAVPGFEKQPEADEELVVMAQDLLVAANRYGLDRLKAICEHRLSLSVGVATVASTLALAVQYNCSDLKARCVDFIARGSPKNLHARAGNGGVQASGGQQPLGADGASQGYAREKEKVTHLWKLNAGL
ncbi:hypothetical protein BS78_08G076500 [Paspalum vaginatum]|nr:hypothetical protein BS78_08G076500 [Paspalum vaginatum]